MSDITKCSNLDCIKKAYCYRVVAIASTYNQSWARFTGGPDCDAFWPCGGPEPAGFRLGQDATASPEASAQNEAHVDAS